jgi:hypothetical protein
MGSFCKFLNRKHGSGGQKPGNFIMGTLGREIEAN